ncbi:MAG: carbohydrate binding domain-containing protein [Firmicutes bacterium]|nr:carbohydrate binding domain-containing protein [Bacillota bacterium]
MKNHIIKIVLVAGVMLLLLGGISNVAWAAYYPAARVIVLSEDSDVKVQFHGGTAGYTSEVWAISPQRQLLFIGNYSPSGQTINLGRFNAGTELIFGIYVRNTGYTYLTGPGSRNPDGQVHSAIWDVGYQVWGIGFEDLYGGGDRDFDDIVLTITGSTICVLPPDNKMPVAVAGSDQIVQPGATITLDGNNSYDPDQNYPLKYTWTLKQKPQNSQALIVNPNQAIASTTIDAPGDYVFQLGVTDTKGAPSVPATVKITAINPENILQNSSFDNGIDDWFKYYDNSAAQINLSWDTADSASPPGSLRVQCYNNGASYQDIQLLTNRFNLIKDRTYLLTFKAKSSAAFTIPFIKLNQAVSPWTDYAVPYTGLNINTGWQEYAIVFTATATASDARVTFFLGGALPEGASFNLDDVSLKEFVANPPATGELLPNPGFDLGKTGWNLSCDSTAQVSGYLDSSDIDTAPVSYRIDCTQSGSSVNAVQLFTMPFNLTANKKYQLTFRAKCSSSFAIPSIRLMKATSPWTIYAWPLGVVSITTEWQTYTVNFTAYSTASDGRLTFFLGNALPPGAVFWVDSASLKEVGQ